jgi:hypothetical protein
MTCEICVMNRHAAVLAADSASTVSRWIDGNLETRYFKGANKIFQLSHHQPVGLMIFNSADLLQVPWEILIKGFRDHLASKTFNDLDGYASEFFSFLDGNARYFPEQVQTEELYAAAERAAIQLVLGAIEKLEDLKQPETLAKLRAAIMARHTELAAMPLPNRFAAEQLPRVVAAHRMAVSDRLHHFGKLFDIPEEDRDLLAELAIHELFKRPSELFGTAGLVFAGFGDHDIFPKVIEYRSSGMLDGTQIITEIDRAAVDHSLPATLNAFAQTSMTDTFSLGFSEDVYSVLMDCLVSKLSEFAAAICTELRVDIATVAKMDEMIASLCRWAGGCGYHHKSRGASLDQAEALLRRRLKSAISVPTASDLPMTYYGGQYEQPEQLVQDNSADNHRSRQS